MRLLSVLACVALLTPAASSGWAQDSDQTLADIRQELSVLYVDVQRLKRELSTTGAPLGTGYGGSALARIDAIEAAMQQVTAKVEQLEHRINAIVSDGSNRIGDLEFRLCELEADCDIGQLGETTTLGGDFETSPVTVATVPDTTSPELAVGEQADFDQATTAMNEGRAADAVSMFERFLDAYPGSPLTAQVHLKRGDGLDTLGEKTGSARAYLDSFSAAPSGPVAAEALFKLGRALGQLGQTSEACVTLSEVGVRFPGAAVVTDAEAERARLGCS
ncbi:MAG: tetratricopeptide repeat protein [Thalassovita sp.]|nr:tetratricopeptide repeat protein [Thalassovita sp.]